MYHCIALYHFPFISIHVNTQPRRETLLAFVCKEKNQSIFLVVMPQKMHQEHEFINLYARLSLQTGFVTLLSLAHRPNPYSKFHSRSKGGSVKERSSEQQHEVSCALSISTVFPKCCCQTGISSFSFWLQQCPQHLQHYR